MNKSDLEKQQEEYNKFFEDTPFGWELDRIARDIIDRQNNAMAMEFTRTIAELLRENGISVHCTEHSHIKDSSDKSIEKVYGVIFDSVDCTEHDKPFKDEISWLKHELEESEKKTNELEEIIKRHKFKDTKDILKENEELKAENAGLHCEIQAMNAMPDSEYAKELEKQISDLETELSVKENLLKIKNGLCGEKPHIHIIGLREFGGEQYMRYSDVEDLIKELEER